MSHMMRVTIFFLFLFSPIIYLLFIFLEDVWESIGFPGIRGILYILGVFSKALLIAGFLCLTATLLGPATWELINTFIM